ncbi:MAG: saccharopine dehydrogenase-like NADP-dependent oxidoreductase [Luteibaculaceae bacterium]|jgi:saccharopine dehydrogenase-like NADP-dependent oxidoreductase
MKTILVIGAGRSASTLLNYLLKKSLSDSFHLIVMDKSQEMLERKTKGEGTPTLVVGDALDADFRAPYLQKADVIISMLPAHLHFDIVNDAVNLGKQIITPSYISDKVKALHETALKNGSLVLCEMGLDPGIDHMSAKKILDEIKADGYEMDCFESFCGGLVAPESDNNPWGYKFTWNPRNVVLAGSAGTVKFIQENQYKYIPYHKLFRRTEKIEIPEYGTFEGYANRDSLSYREAYDLENIPTIFRGTLRSKGFCKSWDLFVQLGATDDSYVIEDSEHMTNRTFINAFLPYSPTDSVELKFQHFLGLPQDDERFEKMQWLGIFSDEMVGLKGATPAQILQQILEKKWSLDPEDKDMIVMWHKFVYFKNGKYKERHSSMVLVGEIGDHTAMAQTVGLPLGIAAIQILKGAFTKKGVCLPLDPEIYNPVLDELEEHGITFQEQEVKPHLYRDSKY